MFAHHLSNAVTGVSVAGVCYFVHILGIIGAKSYIEDNAKTKELAENQRVLFETFCSLRRERDSNPRYLSVR